MRQDAKKSEARKPHLLASLSGVLFASACSLDILSGEGDACALGIVRGFARSQRHHPVCPFVIPPRVAAVTKHVSIATKGQDVIRIDFQGALVHLSCPIVVDAGGVKETAKMAEGADRGWVDRQSCSEFVLCNFNVADRSTCDPQVYETPHLVLCTCEFQSSAVVRTALCKA